MSLHTKYRPITFKEVVGNDAVVQSLESSLERGEVHSLLFTGPSGCGKTTLARIYANELEAELIEVDAASYSGAKDMRDLTQPLMFESLSGKPRMVIIDECHSLSQQAWQVLLKPVEEAPDHIYFAFCTTEEKKVPKTIRTRCAHHRVEALTDNQMMDLLADVCEQQKDAPAEEVLEACVEAAQGSARQALVNLEASYECETYREAQEACASAASEREVIDLCRALIGRKTVPILLELVGKLPENINPEGARIQIVNYMAAVALKGKKPDYERIEDVLTAFEMPFNDTDKKAPLVLACMRCR